MNRQDLTDLLAMIAIGLSITSSTAFMIQYDDVNIVKASALPRFDAISKVACGSDSMGLLFRCGDQLLLRQVEDDSELIPGRIYIYRDVNYTVVHRLVACADEACTDLVFRGDNNAVGEHVNRSAVDYEVVGVKYREGVSA